MKPLPQPRLSVAALRVLTPPLFAIRHCEAALQRAQGLAQADRASDALKDRYARDRERALRFLVGKARP